jgi:hypothetical protein
MEELGGYRGVGDRGAKKLEIVIYLVTPLLFISKPFFNFSDAKIFCEILARAVQK